MTKPDITLRNISYNARLSQETNAFAADIYVDGKKFAEVRNDGWGGSDLITPYGKLTYRDVEALEKRIKETCPKVPSGFSDVSDMEPDLELICGDIMDRWIARRSFSKVLKRITYVKNDNEGVYQLPTKYKVDDLKRIKAATPWMSNVTILNEIDVEKAFDLYMANT
jgi:hypothetical protein